VKITLAFAAAENKSELMRRIVRQSIGPAPKALKIVSLTLGVVDGLLFLVGGITLFSRYGASLFDWSLLLVATVGVGFGTWFSWRLLWQLILLAFGQIGSA